MSNVFRPSVPSDLEGLFIDPTELRNNLYQHCLSKARIRKNGVMNRYDQLKIEKILELTDEEIYYIVSPELYSISDISL
jgi:hypothetical protein